MERLQPHFPCSFLTMEVTNNCFVTNKESYLLVLFCLYENELYTFC